MLFPLPLLDDVVCAFLSVNIFFSLLKKVLHFFSLTYFCNKHNMIKHHNTKSISRRVWDFSSYSVFSVVITLVSSIANRCPLAVMCVHHHHHHRRQAGSSICVNFSWEKWKRKKIISSAILLCVQQSKSSSRENRISAI